MDPRSTFWRTQNFLRDPRTAERIVALAGVGPSDVVYEVGAGAGVITERLAAVCRRVVAVEKDPRLAAVLRERFAGRGNVEVHRADALRHPLPPPPYKVVANPPFDVVTAIITRLVTAPAPPEDACLVVQREAADRFIGRPAETLFALRLKPWFAPGVLHRFRRSDFVPAPGVDAVLLRLRKRGPPLVRPEEARLYRDFVVAVFTAWQPAVGPALGTVLGEARARRLLRAVGLDGAARPSRVPFEAWLALFEAFAATADAAGRRAVAGAEARLRRQQARLEKRHRTRRRRERGDARAVRPGETSETRGPPGPTPQRARPTPTWSQPCRTTGASAPATAPTSPSCARCSTSPRPGTRTGPTRAPRPCSPTR
jgi:23S rRNA (adenine-N6)-dimethyltransferase